MFTSNCEELLVMRHLNFLRPELTWPGLSKAVVSRSACKSRNLEMQKKLAIPGTRSCVLVVGMHGKTAYSMIAMGYQDSDRIA
jgi:hypothetical protein